MARSRRLKKNGDACYHVMSRTNDRRFLFGKGRFKSRMIGLLKRAAEFSGVKLLAYCMMDDHFHIVCRIVRPEGVVPESEVLRRIAVLKGERFAARLARQLADLRLLAPGGQTPVDGAGAGGTPGGDRAAELLGRWTRRMHDVSEFAKTFKELVDIEYKAFRRQEDGKAYCGSLWAGRFKSTLIEDGKYLATCVRYVELNPVRARMTKQARNYAYSSAADEELTKGREGLSPLDGGMREEWLMRRVAQIGEGKVLGGYEFVRKIMFGLGARFAGNPTARPVFGDVYATHGHRIAAKLAKEAA